MEEHEKGIEFVESILSKEQEELLQSKRQHHTDWDNHILTLSTASLGFTFTFLPISSNNGYWLLIIGVFSFIFSICFATANYIIADLGLNYSLDRLSKKLIFNTKLKQNLFTLNKAKENSERQNDESIYIKARTIYDANVSKLFEEIDFDKEIKERDKNNSKIIFLNHAKTYAFISGILFVVVFSLLNITEFTK